MILAAACCLLLGSSHCYPQDGPSPLQCELRIVWGGDAARSFSGSVAVVDGTIKLVRNLSLQGDSINSIHSNDTQTLAILPRIASQFGGMDVLVRGSTATRLKLQFEDPFLKQPQSFEVALQDVLHGSWVQPLDSRGNRLAIERQLHDILRVTSDHPSLILDAGEKWQVNVAGYRTGLPAGQYAVELRFTEDNRSEGEAVRVNVAIDTDGNFASFPAELAAPTKGDAYLLEIEVNRRNYLKTLVASGPSLLRRVDFVVFDKAAVPLKVDSTWKTIAAMDPLKASRPGSLAWLTSFDVLTPLGLPNGKGVAEILQPYNPLSGSLHQPVSHGTLHSRKINLPMTIGASSSEAECLTLAPQAWLAIPLHGLVVNQPHRIRVRVPADQSMELAFSIAQTDSRNELAALSLDTGIKVDSRQGSDSHALSEKTLVFWPQSEKSFVLLANTHRELDASVWDVQLERAGLTGWENGLTVAAKQDLAPMSRMVGIHLSSPLLADSVSVERTVDSVTGRELESWLTWERSIARICQHMESHAANTLMVTAFTDGGAIFPSQRLGPTHRFDSGTFFSDGRSVEIKDSIELMLRHFDRVNYRLVLSLDISSALPNLLRFEGELGKDTILQQSISAELSQSPVQRPHYNPLNSRVQEELVAAIREIVDRYKHHRSFAGIAIQLDRRSQLVFEGDRWGYDPLTLEAFERSSQLKLPPREQLEAVFSGPARLTFLDWRAGELAKFFQRLGEIVSSAEPEHRKLYLNAVRMWDGYPEASQFFNPEAIVRSPQEYLLACGISPERLAASPHVELMVGSMEAVSDSVNSRDWLLHESSNKGLTQYAARTSGSAVVLHSPKRHVLEATAKLGSTDRRLIYPTCYACQDSATRSLADQVFHADSLFLVEGGWLPFGVASTARNSLYHTLRDLPPIKLQPIALREKDSNLCVRLAPYNGKTYIQIVNSASWAEQIHLGLTETVAVDQFRVLGDQPIDLVASDVPGHWSLTIQPYAVIGIEVDLPDCHLASFQHTPVSNTKELIASQLAELEALIALSADLTQQKLLANIEGEFEKWTDEQSPLGWSVSSLPQVTIHRSDELPHTGGSSLLIENRSKGPVSAWAQSRAVQPPRTGRVAVQAWLRVPAVSDPVLVKLAVNCRTHTGERIERAVNVGRKSDSSSAIAIDWGRKPIVLYVGDISSENIAELSVSIELIGPGKVWVDDVQVFESFLQPDERNHVRGQLLVAKQQLAVNNLYPAEQLLDSQWGKYLLRFRPQDESALKTATTDPAGMATPAPAVSGKESWSETPSTLRQLRESIRGRLRR